MKRIQEVLSVKMNLKENECRFKIEISCSKKKKMQCAYKVSTVKVCLSRRYYILIKKTLIFFKIVLVTSNMLFLASFSLVKAPLKNSIWKWCCILFIIFIIVIIFIIKSCRQNGFLWRSHAIHPYRRSLKVNYLDDIQYLYRTNEYNFLLVSQH